MLLVNWESEILIVYNAVNWRPSDHLTDFRDRSRSVCRIRTNLLLARIYLHFTTLTELRLCVLLLNQNLAVVAAVRKMILSSTHEEAVFVSIFPCRICLPTNLTNLLLVECNWLKHFVAVIVLRFFFKIKSLTLLIRFCDSSSNIWCQFVVSSR